MAARPFIVLGDRTSHGGTVVEASQVTFTHDKPLARVGDQVTCPIPGHGTTVIVEGDPTMIIDGKPVARHGDKCACGATLISSQVVSTVGDGGTSNPQAASDEQKAKATAAGVFAQYVESEEDDLEYYFVAERNDGRRINLAYRIDANGEKLHEGRLGPNGETKAFPMDATGEPTFWIPA